LRIIHTESSLGFGGQQRRILAECLGMRDRGHQVWIAAKPTGPLWSHATDAGIEVVPLAFTRPRLPVDAVRLRARVRRLRPHVVNSHSSTDSWTAFLAQQLGWGGTALVRTRHTSAIVRPDPLHRFQYGRTNFIVTTGESVRERLAGSGLVPVRRSMSIPTGIDLDRFGPRPDDRPAARRSLGLDEAGPVIGVVAYLRSYKGHAILVRALPAILRTQPDAVVVLVGDGPERQALQALADRLRVASRVRFAGVSEDVSFVLSAFDVFCLPSLRNEGVPQAILQASAAGLPVASTTVGGIAEAVVNGVTGSIVPAGDPPALAAAILELLDDPARRRAFGEAGRRHVSGRFTFETMLDRTEAAYEIAVDSAAGDKATATG
jgi:glycosyltransferase involved in cell wall biosynthesis